MKNYTHLQKYVARHLPSNEIFDWKPAIYGWFRWNIISMIKGRDPFEEEWTYLGFIAALCELYHIDVDLPLEVRNTQLIQEVKKRLRGVTGGRIHR
jgi:hypothetical protein